MQSQILRSLINKCKEKSNSKPNMKHDFPSTSAPNESIPNSIAPNAFKNQRRLEQDRHYRVEFAIKSCDLEKSPPETMRIIVMTANEQITFLDVVRGESVENVKALLGVETRVPLVEPCVATATTIDVKP